MKIKQTAKLLQSMGGQEDTILAHINPQEAALLKAGGGSGKRNPKTGLLSFGYGDGLDGGYDGPGDGGGGGGPNLPDRPDWAAIDAAQFGTAQAPVSIGTPFTSDWGNQLEAARAKALEQQNMIAKGLGVVFGPLIGTGVGALNSMFGKQLADKTGYDNAMRDAAIAQGWGPGAMPGYGTDRQESGYGGDNAMSGRDNPGAYAGGLLGTPLAPPAAVTASPAYVRPAFVSKFGKPRSWATSAYSPARRGLLEGLIT